MSPEPSSRASAPKPGEGAPATEATGCAASNPSGHPSGRQGSQTEGPSQAEPGRGLPSRQRPPGKPPKHPFGVSGRQAASNAQGPCVTYFTVTPRPRTQPGKRTKDRSESKETLNPQRSRRGWSASGGGAPQVALSIETP